MTASAPDHLLTHLEPYTFQDGFARPSLDAVCGLKGPLHQNPGEELKTYDFPARARTLGTERGGRPEQ